MEVNGKNWCIWRTQSRLLFNILALTHKAQWKWTFWMWILQNRITCTNLRDLFKPPTLTSWTLNAAPARISPLSSRTPILQSSVTHAPLFCAHQLAAKQSSPSALHGDAKVTESDLQHNRASSPPTAEQRAMSAHVLSALTRQYVWMRDHYRLIELKTWGPNVEELWNGS